MEVNKLTAFDKIKKCIESCTTLSQLRNSSKMALKFEYIYKDKLYVDKLRLIYNKQRTGIYKSMGLSK